MRQYYSCRIRIQNQVGWIIWFTNDIDGVYLDESGSLPVFKSHTQLSTHLRNRGLGITKGSNNLTDFDYQPTQGRVNCVQVLNLWNLIEDVQRTIGKRRKGSKLASKVYENIFYGNNLPSINTSERVYKPVFTQAEFRVITAIISTGRRILTDILKWHKRVPTRKSI